MYHRRVSLFYLTQAVRFISGLCTIPLGTIAQTQVMAVNKLMKSENCSPCYGSQYLWIHWVLFSIGTTYAFPHVILTIRFFLLKKKTYKEYYMLNYEKRSDDTTMAVI